MKSFFVLSSFIIGIILSLCTIIYLCFWPDPEPKTYTVEILDEAEVFLKEDVTEGTFKIQLPFEELIHMEGRVIQVISSEGITYWKPKNDGVFYFSKIIFPDKNWKFFYWLKFNDNRKMIFDENSASVTLTRQGDIRLILFFSIVAGIVLFVCLLLLSVRVKHGTLKIGAFSR